VRVTLAMSASNNTNTDKKECKFAPGTCPFGHVCRYSHKNPPFSKVSGVKNVVNKHVERVTGVKPKIAPHVSGQKTTLSSRLFKTSHDLKQVLAPYVELVKGHVSRRDADLKAEEDRYARDCAADRKYFMVDSKDSKVAGGFDSRHVKAVDKINSDFDEAVKMVRQMVLTAVGFKAIKVPMVQLQNFASTITTGVVNTTANITPNNFVDFSTFALIFEEYRLVAGHYTFQASAAAAYGASTPANTGPIFGVLTYSQITSSLANVAAGFDDQQKKIVKFSNLQSGFTDSLAPVEVFHYKIPPGVLDDANSSGAGNWTLVANNTTIWGVLRPYGVVLSAAVIANAISGINTVEMEFRMRI